MSTIKPADLETIIDYQKLCKDEAPVTTKATFRLSELELLIKEIKKRVFKLRPDLISKDGKINKEIEYKCHTVCITFVREKIKSDHNLITSYSQTNQRQLLIENSVQKNGKYYTQVIPIISGCISELDSEFHNDKFKYLENESGIPFVHPGGEGTGLIPPPPKGGK
jgi:ribosomal protein S18